MKATHEGAATGAECDTRALMSETTTPSAETAAPPGLFILGMHRSGTSCLTGMLEDAGFNVGDVDRWNPDNPKGNREHLAVTPLNEGLLRLHGGAWDDPPARIEVDEAQRRKMDAIVAELESAGRPWLIKDPRILLMPGPWLSLRPDARRLGVVRHPLAVARSLERRDDLLEEGPFPLLLFTSDPERLERTTSAILEESFGDAVRAGTLAPERLGDFFDADLVHHAPPLGLDLAPELAAAGVEADTARRAGELWRALAERQAPHALALQEQTAEDAAPAPDAAPSAAGDDRETDQESDGESDRESDRESASKAADSIIDDGDLATLDAALADSTDPVPLFRAAIRRFAARDAHAELATWLHGWHERRPEDPFLAWELAKAHWADGERAAAVRHAETAMRLAPSWPEPPARLAEWAWSVGDWEAAARRYRALYAARQSVERTPDPAAQLFFDRGQGFAAEASLTQSYEGEDVGLSLVAGELGHGVNALRLDPDSVPVVIADLALTAVLAGGDEARLDPVGDNALFQLDGARHFETGDPQLRFDLGSLAPAEIETVKVSFTVRHRGEAVRDAQLSTLAALARRFGEQGRQLRSERQKTQRRRIALAALDAERRQLDAALATLRERFEAGLAGTLLGPLTLGRGPEALDELETRWRALAGQIQSLARGDED